MANHLRKEVPSPRMGRMPAPQPDYPDEITPDQLAKIAAFVDAQGTAAANRTPLYDSAW